MGKKMVVALGVNAILSNDASAQAQQQALVQTSAYLVHLIKQGHRLIVSHAMVHKSEIYYCNNKQLILKKIQRCR